MTGYITLFLKDGEQALVDIEDFMAHGHLRWSFRGPHGNKYVRLAKRIGKSTTNIAFHRLIMGATKLQIVDHINGNVLDNRKTNLRFCTVAQNRANAKKRSGGISKFKGVTYSPLGKRKWGAVIKHNKKKIYLGCYETEIEAATIYDQAARELFGNFARVNFPRDGEQGCL